MKPFSSTAFALPLLLLAAPALAVTVEDCTDYRTSVAAVAEPLEQNTRAFGNGAIRLVVTDTIEPAGGALHLVVIHPPVDEVGGRQCHVVSLDGGLGFSGLELTAATARYDPATGLTVVIPVGAFDPSLGDVADATLAVTINQATGQIRAGLE